MGSLVLKDRIQFYRRRRSAVALFYSISLIVAVLLPYQCVLSEAIDQSEDQGKPNLIMIMTDEHNLRTLQCYRDLMEKDQAYPWGGGVKVKTPYIDSLASNGAIFKNFYTVSPLCTPSRASFMTGKYPQDTGGSFQNHGVMDKDMITFAEELINYGFYTAYFGKWHLNGKVKPGWSNEDRKFGFYENKYQFNRGHWKYFEDVKGTRTVDQYEWKERAKFSQKEEVNYATDFVFDRGIDFIDRMVRKQKNFAVVLSITDPHAPNEVRSPYNATYENSHFQFPPSGKAAAKSDPSRPLWASHALLVEGSDKDIKEFENDPSWQNHMSSYFGMVKCIDDNVGKLLTFLDDLSNNGRNITDETIIVFTSDHGDQLGEHGKFNKGTPYESSAGIPFIVRYPKKIKKGKIIETPYSSIDFAPTILNLMGVEEFSSKFHGIDASSELLNSDNVTDKPNQIRFSFDTAKKNRWAAAIMNGYKLVVSRLDLPWFFDLAEDPDELYNVIDDPRYKDTVSIMKEALLNETSMFSDTFFSRDHSTINKKDAVILWDVADCHDSRDVFYPHAGNKDKPMFCSQVDRCDTICDSKAAMSNCPLSCGTCCSDSVGTILVEKQYVSCLDLEATACHFDNIKRFCPVLCGICTPLTNATSSC